MRFTKMHGLGNDFVVLDEPAEVTSSLVRDLCDRHTGVGADGVLTVGLRGDVVTMGYWNADGSEAEMCGNGLRCVALHAVDRGLAEGAFTVETPAGLRHVEVDEQIRAEIGVPAVGDVVQMGEWWFRSVDVGNPHAVTEVADPATAPVAEIGAKAQALFDHGVNVEFARFEGSTVDLRVWERGVGETLACGSGMVAAAAISRRNGGGDQIAITVPGGSARVEFVDGTAWLVGPAQSVFVGEWPDG